MQRLAFAAEESDVEQSWPGLFWLPPAVDEPHERNMLHLDDELAGLIEAADTPADQHVAHSAKPEAASSVPGDGFMVHVNLAATLAMCCAVLRCAALRYAALRCAMLRCAALRCAALRCAALCCAVLRCAAPYRAVLCCAKLCCAGS